MYHGGAAALGLTGGTLLATGADAVRLLAVVLTLVVAGLAVALGRVVLVDLRVTGVD